MQFEFKPVRKEIDLAQYAPEMEGAKIQVRVNVTREVLGRMLAVSAETPNGEFWELLRELWGPEDWPVEHVQMLWEHCVQQDPQLWRWLCKRTFDLVMEYQAGQKN